MKNLFHTKKGIGPRTSMPCSQQKTKTKRMKTHQKTCLTLASLSLATGALASSDYGPAIWSPVCSGHWYTSGYGHKFAVIHDMEGYYLSSVSYLRSCSTQASVHYAVNGKQDTSTDHAAGEISQLVLEAYYAWHANCWNQHSVGTEHEGFANNPAWYTMTMYQASGGLNKHMAEKFGFAKDRYHIVGHGEKSNAAWASWAGPNLGIDAYCNTHTDPGPYWDWAKYMNVINGVNNRVGMARTASGQGYWIVASDGGVFSFGDANFYGSMGGQALNKPIVGMAARPQGDGYWLVASDGGIFAFGNAGFYGSMGGQPLNQPIVAMAVTQSGNGYWMVAKDGGIFSFGDAPFYGSLGGQGYTDIVGMAPAHHAGGGNGYWLVRAGGYIYSYNANYYGGGDAGSGITGITSYGDSGYIEVRNNGNIYAYGNVCYNGGANDAANPFVGIARGPDNCGYWIVKKDGAIFSFGSAPFKGGANF